MGKRITLADIAEKAEVSKATVSLALNAHPRISAATRERIQKIAEELGYRPDPALASLASYRWEHQRGKTGINLAVIIEDTDLIQHFFPGVCAEAERLGYNLETVDCSAYASAHELSRTLLGRGVEGVIICARNPDWLKAFDWKAFAAVNATHIDLPVELHQVRADPFESVQGAWRKVRELGYRRIGMAVFHDTNLKAVGLRRVSAADCIRNRLQSGSDHFSLFEQPFVDFNESGARKNLTPFAEWMEKEKPDVVIGTNEVVYWYLRELGYSVPDDVALALIRRGNQKSLPIHFAGMTCDENLLGRRMIDELDLMIKHGEKGPPEHPYTTVLPPYWVDGQSCPPKQA